LLTKPSRKYCNNQCHCDFKWKKRVAEIEESGIENSSPVAKKYLINKRGRQCEICKITCWMGEEVPLVLDHIDGNSENNLVSNLRLVCGNCDMQLPTYKAKNTGNGRAYRRKRYAEEKSY
jgi:hypothetical protein